MTDTCELSTEADTAILPAAEPLSLGRRIRDAAARHGDVLRTVCTAFLVFGLFAVQGIILARLLGPTRRGEYGTAVFYTQSLTYLGLLGSLLAIARRAARNAEGLPNLRRVVLRLGLMTGIGTALVVAVLALTALPAHKQYLAPLCVLCACMLPLDHIRLALLSVDHGSGAFRKYNLNLLVNAAALPTMLAAFWFAGVRSLEAVAGVTILVPIIALLYRLFTDGRAVIGARAEPPVRTLIAEGIPYAFAQAAATFLNRLDGLLMLWMVSLTVQGYYAAATSASNVLLAAPEALALFAFRSSAGSSRGPDMRTLVNTGLIVAAAQVVSLIGLSILLEPLIGFVFGASFRGAVPFARLLLPAQAICGLTYVAGGYLRGRGKASVEMWSRIVGAVVMFVAAFAFRERWNDLSVPIAAICGHSASAVLIGWVVFQDVRRQGQVAHAEPVAP